MRVQVFYMLLVRTLFLHLYLHPNARLFLSVLVRVLFVVCALARLRVRLFVGFLALLILVVRTLVLVIVLKSVFVYALCVLAHTWLMIVCRRARVLVLFS